MSGEVNVSWYFGEETRGLDWNRFAQPQDGARPRLSFRRRMLLSSLVLVIAGGISAGLLIRRYVLEETRRVKEEIGAAIEWESWAWSRSEYPLVAERIDPDAPGEWRRWYLSYIEGRRRWARSNARQLSAEVTDVEFLDGGIALVEVRVEEPEVPDDSGYIEHRLYKSISGEWMRSAPDASYWGGEKKIETERFRFFFYERDAEVATAVASVADEMADSLDEMMGLPSPSVPFSVKIQPENVGVGGNRLFALRLVLLAPELDRVEIGHTPQQHISASLAEALTRRAAVQHYQRRGGRLALHWVALHDAIQDWIALQIDPLAPKTDWVEIGSLRHYVDRNGLPSLQEIQEPRDVRHSWAASWPLVASQTVLEFGRERYGPVEGATLLGAVFEYESWDQFTRALYGVDSETFEAEWHGYLRDRYGL